MAFCIVFLQLFVAVALGKQLVVFGDNYSINGLPNNTVLGGAYPDLFSQHTLWVDFLRQRGYGHDLLNYAVGGSTLLDMIDNCDYVEKEFGYNAALCEEMSRGIMPQIEAYLDDTEGERVPKDTMILILFSGNDYILAAKEKDYVKEIPMMMAEQIEQAIQMLLENGLSNIKLATLPPLQWAPYLHRDNTYQMAVVQYLFESNAPIIFMSRKYKDQGVKLINVEEYLMGVIFEMYSNGINIDLTCKEVEGDICKNDLKFYWLDDLNPTSHIHHELATWMTTQLV